MAFIGEIGVSGWSLELHVGDCEGAGVRVGAKWRLTEVTILLRPLLGESLAAAAKAFNAPVASIWRLRWSPSKRSWELRRAIVKTSYDEDGTPRSASPGEGDPGTNGSFWDASLNGREKFTILLLLCLAPRSSMLRPGRDPDVVAAITS
ncbi:hypothetical protein RRF57_011321 [Xylaria bambusicola]|uniref:Uncharacterized protein n=1 Tax=Xylaria bambusicola TaxID=326684 RepID=A0AAN7UML3_9PEZI